jgi:hypothetical protein
MIRTLVEIQGGRVSIQETGAETTVTVTVDGAPSSQSPSELGRLAGQKDRISDLEAEVGRQRSRAHGFDLDRKSERDRADRLQAELTSMKNCHVCTASCKPNAHVAFTGSQRLKELEEQLHDETERADQNKAWAERAEAEVDRLNKGHARRVAELEKDIDALTLQIEKVSIAVHGSLVVRTLQLPWTSWEEKHRLALVKAVRDVRRTIGPPGPETSQA